ncbi:hypothetical protein [Tsukamurella paurometabola]|uniref:Uncharacterized protein n=1 Tax=Tsukamurella paurometabola TaxID=2061 RepID=A0ABS5NES8_TSUPA|nr:hypothetical protein [Tsukamurella paurometabola]MBS4102774.1 hypothetical protein [Tsukamurella paurometabola]
MTRPIPAAPLPTGDVYEAEHDLMMRLGEAVNAAHHLAAVAPEEAHAVGLDDMVDGWEQQLGTFHWRTVGARRIR